MENSFGNWIRRILRQNHQVLNASTYLYFVQFWLRQDKPTKIVCHSCAVVRVHCARFQFSEWQSHYTAIRVQFILSYHIWSFAEQIKHFGFRFGSFALKRLGAAITFRANDLFSFSHLFRELAGMRCASVTKLYERAREINKFLANEHTHTHVPPMLSALAGISIKSFSRKWIQIIFMKIGIRFFSHVWRQQTTSHTAIQQPSAEHQLNTWNARVLWNWIQLSLLRCILIQFGATEMCLANYDVSWQMAIECAPFVISNYDEPVWRVGVEWVRCACQVVIARMIRSANLPRAGQ